MANRRKYTDDQFVEAVADCTSWSQVIQRLGLRPGGGVYRYLRELADRLDVDTSHMKGQGWSRGLKSDRVQGRPLEDYLSNKHPIGTYHLKNKLWKAGLLERRCYECELTEWLGEPAPLQLDHIDGNRQNNNLSNLRILCPNCHALTETYSGRNKGFYQ